jgi:hypothetical protein
MSLCDRDLAVSWAGAGRGRRAEAAVGLLNWPVGAGGGAVFGLLPGTANNRLWVGAV